MNYRGCYLSTYSPPRNVCKRCHGQKPRLIIFKDGSIKTNRPLEQISFNLNPLLVN